MKKIIIAYKKQILVLSALFFLSSGFSLFSPYISKLVIDEAFIGRSYAKFLNLSLIGISIFILSAILNILAGAVRNRITTKLNLKLANKFTGKLYYQDLAFLESKSAGENAFRLSDITRIANFLTAGLPDILVDVIKFPVILFISLKLNARMTLCLLVLSPFFLVQSIYIRKKIKVVSEQMWRNNARLSKVIYEGFSKMLIVKALGLERFQRHGYLRLLIENIRWDIKNFKWATISSVSASFLSRAIFGLITLYGGWLIIRGDITLGGYTAVMLYLKQLGGLFGSFCQKFENYSREAVSFEKFFEIMRRKPAVTDSERTEDFPGFKKEIRFSNMWFAYEKERFIFKGLNFSLPCNLWLAIAGASGCGKTTLINLILRLYDSVKGEIFFDNVDLKQIKLSSLRRATAIATQQPLLFDVSIRENITFGLKDKVKKDVEEAGAICCLDDFIASLPCGYDTGIGGEAFRLSGGLKQRIAIARAVIRNPDLLILDEATSSIDSLTEEKILKNIRSKRIGKTTIVISHRLTSIKDADIICFLDKSGSIEQGSHDELFIKNSNYQEFFQNQESKKGTGCFLSLQEK